MRTSSCNETKILMPSVIPIFHTEQLLAKRGNEVLTQSLMERIFKKMKEVGAAATRGFPEGGKTVNDSQS